MSSIFEMAMRMAREMWALELIAELREHHTESDCQQAIHKLLEMKYQGSST